MAIECAYSFRDLYIAAHKREPKDKELKNLYSLQQNERNRIVKHWSEVAGWQTRERRGSDGVTYLAFAPNFMGDAVRGDSRALRLC